MSFRAITVVAILVFAAAHHSTIRALQSEPPTRSVWDGVYTEEQAKRGAALNKQHCASCHGEYLTGGEMAPPLAGPAFSANWNGLSLGDILERIRITMPLDHPGALTRQQNADVLAYILSVNKFPVGKAELARQTEILKQVKFVSMKP